MSNVRSLGWGWRPLVVVALCSGLGLVGCSGFMTQIGGGVTPELQKSGVVARAEIREIWDTGWTINDNPVIGMKVMVLPADGPAFEAIIEKTTVSRIALSQFQPGGVVPVRYDPANPAAIAVDYGAEVPETSASGNPYSSRYEAAQVVGASFLPAPEVPEIYLGTGDSAADLAALYENDYALLGGARVQNGSDPQLALDQGVEIGAALVVVYGRFVPAAGAQLEVLPYRMRPMAPGAAGLAAGAIGLASGLGPNDQFAAYWGKTRPPILGIVSRPLNADEQAKYKRKDGIVVESVSNGSPAADGRIVAGDILVGLDGEDLPDARAVPALITSKAGQRVTIDLLRDGQPYSVIVQLNPAAP